MLYLMKCVARRGEGAWSSGDSAEMQVLGHHLSNVLVHGVNEPCMEPRRENGYLLWAEVYKPVHGRQLRNKADSLSP